MKTPILLIDFDDEFVAEVIADDDYNLILFQGQLYLKLDNRFRTYFATVIHDESKLQVIATKEGNQMNESVSNEFAQVIPLTKSSENQTTPKLNLIFLLIASQLKAFGKAFERTNAATAKWLFWAGKVLEAYCFGYSIPEEPAYTDKFNSPIPDVWRGRFEILGIQIESLGFALGMLDADNVGNDDKIAAMLLRVSSVLKALAV